MSKADDPMQGIFQRRGSVYYFQPSQKDGVRPPMVSLETTDRNKAIATAAKIRKMPLLNSSTHLLAEVREHLREKVARQEYSRSTADNKLWLLRRWIVGMSRDTGLTDVTTPLLQKQYDAILRQHSAATAHKFIMTVRAFLNWAVDRGKLRENPAIEVKSASPGDGARIRFCTREQRDKLINHCPRPDLKLVLMLGFHAGFRKNEIIQARPDWFLMEQGVIDLRDTPTFRFNEKKQLRKIPMRRALREFLEEYGLQEPFLLRPEVKHGKSLYRYDFAKPFHDYVKSQRLSWVTPHVLRHTFASLLVMGDRRRKVAPTSIYKVAKWLGDTVATTEKFYAHLAPRDEDIEED